LRAVCRILGFETYILELQFKVQCRFGCESRYSLSSLLQQTGRSIFFLSCIIYTPDFINEMAEKADELEAQANGTDGLQEQTKGGKALDSSNESVEKSVENANGDPQKPQENGEKPKEAAKPSKLKAAWDKLGLDA
jgi:hypothetical protein